MPLASNALLAPHFTAGELRADTPGIPDGAVNNLRAVADYLEQLRAVLGVPLRVTSGYRSPAYNSTLPGASATSDHMTGLAADFVPVGLTLGQSYAKLSAAAPTLPPFDQLIYYPVQGHIHVGLGSRKRREVRIKLYDGAGGTPLLTPDLIARLPGAVADIARNAGSASIGALGIVLLLGALLLLTLA